jgi:hypothetical protein
VQERIKTRVQHDSKIYIHNDLPKAPVYFNAVIREKIKTGTRDAIAFDGMACTVTFISKLAEDPKPIEAG